MVIENANSTNFLLSRTRGDDNEQGIIRSRLGDPQESAGHRIGFNGLAILGAPTHFQPIFKRGILILAVGVSASARRYATSREKRSAPM